MNALSSTLAAFQLKLGLRAVEPTGIEKIDRRAYLIAGGRAASAVSTIEIGRRLLRPLRVINLSIHRMNI
jgi:hypothetical protein